MVTGYIYKITCKKNNKVYIGQTIQPLEQRLYHHFDDAINKGYDYAFANAIRKHGTENFTIEEIERYECKNKKELKTILDVAEKKYIKQYNSYLEGYNSTLGGDGTLGYKLSKEHKDKIRKAIKGRKHTKESIEKMSKIHSGKVLSEETKQKISNTVKSKTTQEHLDKMVQASRRVNCKQVAQYTLEGELIKVYPSLGKASTETKISKSGIGMNCNGQRNSAGGYCWRYVDGEVKRYIKTNANINSISNKSKPVIQYDKEGNFVNKYNSIREASRRTQVVISSIVENCKGKRKTAGGYVWRYEGD
jgi:group I intron endonuclease|nr:MAG TPA: intron associated endonuclease [Caudoviricetes sp.]